MSDDAFGLLYLCSSANYLYTCIEAGLAGSAGLECTNMYVIMNVVCMYARYVLGHTPSRAASDVSDGTYTYTPGDRSELCST